jgi:hypothetical protein
VTVWKEREKEKERERKGPRTRFDLKGTPSMTYFLQLGPTSESFHHIPIAH